MAADGVIASEAGSGGVADGDLLALPASLSGRAGGDVAGGDPPTLDVLLAGKVVDGGAGGGPPALAVSLGPPPTLRPAVCERAGGRRGAERVKPVT